MTTINSDLQSAIDAEQAIASALIAAAEQQSQINKTITDWESPQAHVAIAKLSGLMSAVDRVVQNCRDMQREMSDATDPDGLRAEAAA